MTRLRWLLMPAAALGLALAAFGLFRLLFPSAPASREVVAYVSADQELAEPILQSFESRTGIRVRTVYDLEANKTAGLALRLMAERAHPVADVFWASEPTRLVRLGQEGVLAPYVSPEAEGLPRSPKGLWTAFSSRARVILVNTAQVPERKRPKRLEDLLDPEWKGRIGLADPRFGTTAAYAAAMGASGRDVARRFKANGARLCAGNALVRELVERGELAMGLTDSDDAWAAIDRGMPVAMVVPEPTLVVPNAAGLVAGGPHPRDARLLIDFLLSREVEGRMSEKPFRQPPLRGPGKLPPGMPVDWEALGASVDKDAQAFYEALKP